MASSQMPLDKQTKPPEEPPSKQAILVEYAINFDHQNDLTKIDDALGTKGLRIGAVNSEEKTIQVEFELHQQDGQLGHDIQSVQEHIEHQTGFHTVVKGLGQVFSAVAELRPPLASSPTPGKDTNDVRNVFGVVRLSQLTNGSCFVDGSIDVTKQTAIGIGQQSSRYLVAIHEYGDLSGEVYESIGEPVVELSEQTVVIDQNVNSSTISISRVVPNCDIITMIGKSVAVTERSILDESHQTDNILSAGVIARASTIGFNKKQFCACSGKTLWEERAQRQPNLLHK